MWYRVHCGCFTPIRVCSVTTPLYSLNRLDRQSQPNRRGCHCWKQGCQMKILIKSQTVWNRGQKNANRLFKGQKKAKLCLWYCYFFVTKKHTHYKNLIRNFLQNWDYVLLGLVLKLITDASLTFLGLWDYTFWVQWCHSLHTDSSAGFCPMRKLSPIHSCTYDQNHKSRSTFSRLLSHFYREDAEGRSVYKRWACLVLTTHYTVHTFPVITQKIISNLASLKS